MNGRLTKILPVLAVLALGGCGGDDAHAPRAGASPRAAVEAFAAVAGSPSPENLRKACAQLSPGVRPAMSVAPTLKPDDRDCAGALSLVLYYAGETGEEGPAPSGFTAEAGDVVEQGDRAFVSVRIAYRGVPGSDRSVNVLTVREAGRWWVASPYPFNLRNGGTPLTQPALLAQHEELLTAARAAGKQTEAGENAASAPGSDAAPCPLEGASAAADARGDVKLASSSEPADPQRPSDDLVEVIHNSDADSACFTLRFAGDAPPRGGVEIAIRPGDHRLSVGWEPGKALGQRKEADETLTAVRVEVARDGSTVVVRVPRRELGITTPAYRWAVTLGTQADQESVVNMDLVPDAQTVTDEQDSYIPHGG